MKQETQTPLKFQNGPSPQLYCGLFYRLAIGQSPALQWDSSAARQQAQFPTLLSTLLPLSSRIIPCSAVGFFCYSTAVLVPSSVVGSSTA